MAAALVVLPFCSNGSVVVFVIVVVVSSVFVLVVVVVACHAPSDDDGRRGASAEGCINKIGPWGGPFPFGQRKKGKIAWPCASCDAQFIRENQPKAKNQAMQSHALVLPPWDCIA